MSDSKKLIGERISALRRIKNLTQNELAEKVGLDSRHISRLETGKYYPSLDTLETMAFVLGVELREFFSFPSVETERQLRDALVDIANTAPDTVLREVVPFARNLLGQQQQK